MDHDGVCDNVDFCPTQPGPPENGGCPQIVFNSAGDIVYNTNYVSMKTSASNATLTNVIATATQADQTALNEYYIISVGNFVPTVGQTFSVKSIALKNTAAYGSMLSQTFNINTNAVVKSYDPVSHHIMLTFAGTFVNQAIGNAAKTYNVNGVVSATYTP